MVINNNYQSQR